MSYTLPGDEDTRIDRMQCLPFTKCSYIKCGLCGPNFRPQQGLGYLRDRYGGWKVFISICSKHKMQDRLRYKRKNEIQLADFNLL